MQGAGSALKLGWVSVAVCRTVCGSAGRSFRGAGVPQGWGVEARCPAECHTAPGPWMPKAVLPAFWASVWSTWRHLYLELKSWGQQRALPAPPTPPPRHGLVPNHAHWWGRRTTACRLHRSLTLLLGFFPQYPHGTVSRTRSGACHAAWDFRFKSCLPIVSNFLKTWRRLLHLCGP